MAKSSAGILMYRYADGELQVLLVHPGGPYWRAKDEGAWSIPKGEYDPDEDPLAAAIREFQEETGAVPCGDFIALLPIKQPDGKTVTAFAVQGDFDPSSLRSNTFTIEWPPRSGRMQEFPEVDRAQWFSIAEAERRLLKGQIPLLWQLAEAVRKSPRHRSTTDD